MSSYAPTTTQRPLASIIFNTLDKIEDIADCMAHELPPLENFTGESLDLASSLKKWQDGKMRDIYFSNICAKYLDALTMD